MNPNFTADDLLCYLKSYPGVLFLKDAQGRYCYTSDLCDRVQAEAGNGILGKNELEAQKDPVLGRQYYEEDQRLLKEGGSYKCYSEVKAEGGSIFYEINRSSVQDATGNILGIIGTVTDVTREFELMQQVKRQYVTDPTTGVFNRMYLQEWLKNEQPVFPFSLIVCDCNFLKHINDMFGHEYGDMLLKSAGELFLENLPETCIPVRVGGDEFLLLCNNTTAQEAEQLIFLLTEKAQEKCIQGSKLSIAYGYHTMHQGEMTFEACKNLADNQMYSAKRKMKQDYFQGAGKNDPVYNEKMFQNFIGQMPAIAFFKDTACKYQYISHYNESHLKNKSETHYGIGLTDIQLQTDEARGREYYEDDLKILATGVGSILYSVIVENGQPRHYQITKSAVHDESNNIIGIAGVVMDVTATKVKVSNNAT